MFDVVALGELLIDFTPSGTSKSGNDLFEKNPGGAPANVLAALARLEKSVAFLGMVGNDEFGSFLKNTLEANKINIAGLKFSQNVNTTLAFVHLNKSGDRKFSFYRDPGADRMLSKDDVCYDLIKDSKIFHFGSVSMTDEPSRSATLSAADYAKKAGLMISYDPNLRRPLWRSADEARNQIIEGLKYADILKISEEELEFITGLADLYKGSEQLCGLGIGLVLVTLGPRGCFYCYKGQQGRIFTFDTQVIDTTGSGDAFLAGVLYGLIERKIKKIEELNLSELEGILDFANAMGALAATKKGGIPAMPSFGSIKDCIEKTPRLLIE